uniref:Sema domain-containing protein n=1 Tax=Rhabditophanes sp. KR3021 TaxID=114890 RepID=A0AC35U8H4_9BILA
MKILKIFILLVCQSGILTKSGYSSTSIVNVFDNLNNDMPLQKLVVDKTTEKVFVGGVNYIYHLRPTLQVVHTAFTGTDSESRPCSDIKSCPNSQAHLKALAVYPEGSKLIECTSASNQCHIRNLFDITNPIDVHREGHPIIFMNASTSTTILVAAGPINAATSQCQSPENYNIWKSGLNEVLYVGSTIYNNPATPIQSASEIPPSVASYKLKGNDSEIFRLAVKNEFDGTEVKLVDWNYKIDYISSFQSGAFVYFATQHDDTKETQGNVPKLITKLARVYVNDHRFLSYTEVPLICNTADGVKYDHLRDTYLAKPEYDLAKKLGISPEDDVLFTVFTKEPSKDSSSQVVHSALCVYTMETVEKIFKDNIRSCFRGDAVRNLKHFNKKTECPVTKISDGQMLCGSDAIRYVGGDMAINSEPLMVLENVEATALVVHSAKGFTVAFIGTLSGKLIKTAIKADSFYKYKTIDISNNPVLQDMELDENNEFLYVLTADRLTKLAIRQCTEATDCRSCLEMKDPYCGWCGISGQCISEDQCKSNEIPPLAEFYTHNHKCPLILSVYPNSTQISTMQNVSIVMQNIPLKNQNSIACRYEFPYLKINLTERGVVSNGAEQRISCKTPDLTLLPPIPLDETSLISKLNVIRTTSTNQAVSMASSNFTFYDCRKFYSCSNCMASEYPCNWCVENSQCVDSNSIFDGCRNQLYVNKTTQPTLKGNQFCPQVIEKEALNVAAGESKKFTVDVKNTHNFMRNWICILKSIHEIVEVDGVKNGEQVTCDPVKMDYNDAKFSNGTLILEIVLVWISKGQRQPLDNLFTVNLYKCSHMADNCGSCLTIESQKFDCGWCEGMNSCTSKTICPTGSDYLKTGQICANPKILEFYPKKGPLNGGTELTIIGNNLGRQVSDVNNNIFIGKVKCNVIASKYVPFSKIVCITGNRRKSEQTVNMQAAADRSSNIIIRMEHRKNNSAFTAVSTDLFQYVNPVISTFSPRQGPLSGGTKIIIKGDNLDSGSHVKALIDDYECVILERNATSLICKSGRSREVVNGTIKINFDGTEIPFTSLHYEYKQDPKFLSIDKNYSIMSGGINIGIRGTGFSLIQDAKMVLFIDDVMIPGKACIFEQDKYMSCTTPDVRNVGKLFPTNSSPLNAKYSFFINGAFQSSESNNEQHTKQISIYPDPYVETFKDVRYLLPGGFLTISGENLNKVASENDIAVKISGHRCEITALADKALTCQLPSKERIDDSKFGNSGPEVFVKIGGYDLSVGHLSIDPKATKFSTQFLLVIVVAVAIFVIAFAILLVLYKKKNSSHNRQLKYLRSQMDTIEMRVASECKEAFAELQTSMNALQENYPQGQIYTPFLSYKDYASRILFPHNYPNNPIFAHLEVDSEHAGAIEAGLQQFHKLLCNKTFLLTFIRTMEKNKYFVGKDRVNVGSLLMVILQDKMEYCTDILKQLLKELILKNVESKYQPKVLFRRSESVAERMLSAWFSFFMYKFLRDCGGQQLFQLYWSIKQTTEKGPQDAITMDARYSLSEEKLLRATIDYQELQLHITSDDMDSPNRQKMVPLEFTIRAMSCDTISQVKEKCLDAKYRTMPFSERPSIDEVDIEWVSPTQSFILRDTDNTTKIENGNWKKINTLSHYKIPNNGRLLLIPRQIASSYNLSLLSDRSEKSSLTMINNSPTLGRAFGTNSSSNSKEPNQSSSVYHLVKQLENGPTDHQDKLVSEVYLTRLLTMKGTVQKFIEEFFAVIFSTSSTSRQYFFPMCIKYMFDFMDEQAMEHGITDEEVVHAWKSNALPLRFWVNLIKNPHFLFDIAKPTKIEGNLNVVAQTLMDACSTQEQNLTKDSPSSKLLFAKDIPTHRCKVNRYYSEIRRMPPISEPEMASYFAEESKLHQNQFYIYTALNELYCYVEQYKEAIFEDLSSNELSNTQGITSKFQQMIEVMSLTDTVSTNYANGSLDGYNSASRLMSRDNRFF